MKIIVDDQVEMRKPTIGSIPPGECFNHLDYKFLMRTTQVDGTKVDCVSIVSGAVFLLDLTEKITPIYCVVHFKPIK